MLKELAAKEWSKNGPIRLSNYSHGFERKIILHTAVDDNNSSRFLPVHHRRFNIITAKTI